MSTRPRAVSKPSAKADDLRYFQSLIMPAFRSRLLESRERIGCHVGMGQYDGRTILTKKTTSVAILMLVIATLVASIAAMPATLVRPDRPVVAATANAGELFVSWDAVPSAGHYTVGYANLDDLNQMAAAGRNALDAFYYVTIGAANTNHILSGLKPGTGYYVLIGARTKRFGATDLTWGPWSSEVVTKALPVASNCLGLGTCIPVQNIGTFTGSGDSVAHVFNLAAGVYRFTASRTNTEGNFFIAVIELADGDDRSVGIYVRDQTGGQQALTIYNDGATSHNQEGHYILDVDTDNDWTVTVEQIAAH